MRHPASFINTIAENGSKAEAVEWLQKTWDELCELRELCGKFIDELEKKI